MGIIQEDGWNRGAGVLVREYVGLGPFQEGMGTESVQCGWLECIALGEA